MRSNERGYFFVTILFNPVKYVEKDCNSAMIFVGKEKKWKTLYFR